MARGDGGQLAVIEDGLRHGGDQLVGVVETRIEGERRADVGVGRRRDTDFHEEAVARGGGQLERLLALDAVAVGEHQEIREVVFAVEGADRALGHQAQQQRVHLRPGAVDLVEEEDGEVAAVADAPDPARRAGGRPRR